MLINLTREDKLENFPKVKRVLKKKPKPKKKNINQIRKRTILTSQLNLFLKFLPISKTKFHLVDLISIIRY